MVVCSQICVLVLLCFLFQVLFTGILLPSIASL